MKILQVGKGRTDNLDFIVYNHSDNYYRGSSLKYKQGWIEYTSLMTLSRTRKDIITPFRLELIL